MRRHITTLIITGRVATGTVTTIAIETITFIVAGIMLVTETTAGIVDSERRKGASAPRRTKSALSFTKLYLQYNRV
jgi:hypothetical protein